MKRQSGEGGRGRGGGGMLQKKTRSFESAVPAFPGHARQRSVLIQATDPTPAYTAASVDGCMCVCVCVCVCAVCVCVLGRGRTK